jgi:hypothetical protein
VNDEQRVRLRRRQIAAISWVAAIIAIVGYVRRPDLVLVWSFLFFFSVATVPRWIRDHIRARSKTE